MKSLLDIQQDIRNLELSVKDITENIRSIQSDLEEIRGSSDVGELDYEQIELLARQLPFRKHPLDKLEDGRSCRIYLELLLNIVRLDLEAENAVNRLVFINWLQIQARLSWSLEELYKDCFTRGKELYYEFVEVVPTKYWNYFIVDALIIANIGGKANREILEYIVDLSTILGISKDKLRISSLIAQIVLCQNIGDINITYTPDVMEYLKKYRFYISDDIIKMSMEAMRDIVVELRDDEVKEFRWKVKQMSMVEKGELIAEYYMGYGWEKRKMIHRATSSGKLFQFRNNNTNYGVIAYEADDKDSIRAWVKANRR